MRNLINKSRLTCFFQRDMNAIELDFSHWNTFNLSPRHATHYFHDVIKLMPCSNESLYSFKYINGHFGNPAKNQLSVVALGFLSEVNRTRLLMQHFNK